MSVNGGVQSVVTSSDTATASVEESKAAMWEYEAPKYCDFSSADTFVDNDPSVDKFFLTDHDDSTKENLRMSGESAGSGSDADIFATPLSRPNGKSLGSIASTYKTPKSKDFEEGDAEATPKASLLTGRLSTLRQTPLREIYNQGGTPLHEAGRRVSVFKKSAKKSLATTTSNNNNNSRRETFDMANVSEAIEEISAVATAKEDVSPDKENKQNGLAADNLMSEDEEEEEGKKAAEETVLQVVEDFHSVDAEKELSEQAPLASESNDSLNGSRRSSYIVKSPSIRVVHFADDESANGSKQLEALAEENATTPVVAAGSKSSLKIKARQLTPMVVKAEEKKKPATGTVSKTTGAKNLIQGLLRNRLSKKYIKRFSKSMEEKEKEETEKKVEVASGPSTTSATAGTSAAAPVPKPKPITVGLSKKRVTIAAPPKATSAGAASTSTSTSRGLSLKGTTFSRRRFTTAASVLQQKQQQQQQKLGKPSMAAKTPLKSKASTERALPNSTTAAAGSRPSPYLGLSVLNAKFMSNYCRNYTPPSTLAAATSAVKPKLTVPKSPNLHTSNRCTMRKHHTLPSLTPSAPATAKAAPVVRPKTSSASLPKPKLAAAPAAAAFVPTKAITPKFSTEARLKLWHVKHDQTDGTELVGVKKAGGAGSGFLFKARPMPNFKRMQAVAAKQKAAAIEKGKHSVKPNAPSVKTTTTTTSEKK